MGQTVCHLLLGHLLFLTNFCRIRLYSAKSFKSLGTLKYHKTGCQAVAFVRTLSAYQADEDEDDDVMSKQELEERSRWLIGGAKDKLITIWSLMAFDRT